MAKEPKAVSWEDDQEDETKETKLVKAPNGKYYRIRAISAYDRALISEESTRFEFSGRRGARTADFSVQSRRMTALTLQKGVVEPDFSKLSVEAIEKWMQKKKDAVVTFLSDQIAILSGYALEEERTDLK